MRAEDKYGMTKKERRMRQDKSGTEQKKRIDIKAFRERIMPSSPQVAQRRARQLLRGLLWASLSWILSGGVFLFGTRPFSLVLLCVTESHLIATLIGVAVAAIGDRAPLSLLWGCLVVFIFRMIVSFLPDFHEKQRDGVRQSTGAVMLIEGEGKAGSVGSGRGAAIISLIESLLRISQSDDGGGYEKKRYNESLPAKALFSSIGGFVYGLFLLIGGDYSFYYMFGAFSLIALTPLLVVLLSGADSEGVTARSRQHTVAWFVISCLAVYSAQGTSLIGLPIAPLLCMSLTVFVTGTRSVTSGILIGGVLGLIYSPLYSPLLLLCAALYAFLLPIRKGAGVAAVCGATLLWCYYFGGVTGIVEVLTPMLVGVPLALVAQRYYGELYPDRVKSATVESTSRTRTVEAGVYFAEAVSERNKNESMADRLGALSEAFSSLSHTFNNLVDRFRRPDILGLKRIVDSSLEENCRSCRNRDVCWGAGYSNTLDAVQKMTSALHRKGVVEREDIPAAFLSSCLRATSLISDVNAACEQTTRSIMENEKIGSFASSFDDIGAILKDALDGQDEEYECDVETGSRIYELLCELGYKIKGVVVCGKRNKRVLIKGISPDSDKTGELGAALCRKCSQLVGAPLIGPVFEMSSSETVMMLYSKPRLRAICSHGRLSADRDGEYGEILRDDGVSFYKHLSDDVGACGDCTRVFVNENSYFYSLISDGMGSGSEAALAAEVSSMFVEKMLLAGNRADVTVRMLNNFLRTENMGLGRECSATLDLFELDLMSGAACFIKSGAAPTYICRSNTVYKVNARTMPVGIIKEADAKLTRFETKPWDIVVMISDGCCPESEDCPWLVEYLSVLSGPDASAKTEELEGFTCALKDKILHLAVEHAPTERHPDDISVSVVLISA